MFTKYNKVILVCLWNMTPQYEREPNTNLDSEKSKL